MHCDQVTQKSYKPCQQMWVIKQLFKRKSITTQNQSDDISMQKMDSGWVVYFFFFFKDF